MKNTTNPPKLLLRFFRWFCHPDLARYIEGDLIELFEERVVKSGQRKAKWLFVWDVVKLFRLSIIRPAEGVYRMNNYGMFKNYCKVGIRNILKHKTFSFINIFGLVLGMTSFLFILNYSIHHLGYDSFHINGSQIYRIRNDHFSNETLSHSRAITYRDAGPSLKNDIPDILDFTRMNGLFGRSLTITSKSVERHVKFTEQNVYYVDSNFLTLFTFPLIQGDSVTALADINSVVVTASTAKKYFGSGDPINQVITVDGHEPYKVTGVLKDIPSNSHMNFDFLFPIKALPEYRNRQGGKWSGAGGDVAYTYLLLATDVDRSILDEKIRSLLLKYKNERAINSGMNDQFVLQPLHDIHLYSDLEFEMDGNNDFQTVLLLLIIGLIVLLVAWINYINLTTMRASERAKEMGVRKVIGATKKQLSSQFLIESFLLNLAALFISIVAVYSLYPVFKKYIGFEVSFTLFDNNTSIGFLILIFLFGVVISGLYPAFIMSMFKPLMALNDRGNSKIKGISLINVLSVFQYATSVSLIASTLVIHKQIDFMQGYDLGFESGQVVVVLAPQTDTKNYFSHLENFKSGITAYPDFNSLSASSEVPGKAFDATSFIAPSEDLINQAKRYSCAWVDYNFVPFFDLKMLYGRNFSESFSTDQNAILVNEKFTRSFGFEKTEDAIGQVVPTNRGKMKIIGIIEDYHQVSLKSAIQPLVFFLNSERNRKYISFKLETTDLSGSLKKLQREFEVSFPDDPFEFFFLDDHFNRQYQADQVLFNVFLTFSVLAIFITCLGLFNLSYLTTLNRIKEIGVRKVLGASAANIFNMISTGFVKLVIAGMLTGVPIIWIILQKWLLTYEFRIDLHWWFFVAAGIASIVIVWLTIGYQILRVARVNPVKCLRNE